METTEIVLNEHGRGEVQLLSNGIKIGKMDVLVRDQRLTVYHTEVDPAYEGRGFAKSLLVALVGYAHEKELKVVPLCPYVRAQFQRNPEIYQDVWYKKGEN